ncbi:hypothetical protein ACG3SL_20680 [Sphingomonas sp. CJ20]
MLALLMLALLAQNRAIVPDGEDTTRITLSPKCETSADEITVCGTADRDAFRLRSVAPRYTEQPLRPRLTLPGGAEVEAYAEQRGVGGVSVPSAMVRLKIPLGKRTPEAK